MNWNGGAENNGIIGAAYNGADYEPIVTNNIITLTTSRSVGQTIDLNIKADGDLIIKGVAETGAAAGKNKFTLT